MVNLKSMSGGNVTEIAVPKGCKVGLEVSEHVYTAMTPIPDSDDSADQLQAKLETLRKSHGFLTFGAAWKGCREALGHGSRNFQQSDCAVLTKTFDSLLEGGSALLVNGEGMYSGRAPVTQHYKTLKSWKYKVVPAVKSTHRKQRATGRSL